MYNMLRSLHLKTEENTLYHHYVLTTVCVLMDLYLDLAVIRRDTSLTNNPLLRLQAATMQPANLRGHVTWTSHQYSVAHLARTYSLEWCVFSRLIYAAKT